MLSSSKKRTAYESKERFKNRVATNSEYGPNTEYVRFLKFNEYRIILFF